MSCIKDVVIELSKMYISTNRRNKTKDRAIMDSLDSKLINKGNIESKLDASENLFRPKEKYNIKENKNAKNVVVDYIRGMFALGYSKIRDGVKRFYSSVKSKVKRIFKSESKSDTVKESKEKFLKFYLLLPNESDSRRSFYTDVL